MLYHTNGASLDLFSLRFFRPLLSGLCWTSRPSSTSEISCRGINRTRGVSFVLYLWMGVQTARYTVKSCDRRTKQRLLFAIQGVDKV